ncbi:MAG: hypothetical protein CME06_15360 [Gemmatimonadetes bacterium]|nr:hypothetical protein [Gemmatimonadota bacterium]
MALSWQVAEAAMGRPLTRRYTLILVVVALLACAAGLMHGVPLSGAAPGPMQSTVCLLLSLKVLDFLVAAIAVGYRVFNLRRARAVTL